MVLLSPRDGSTSLYHGTVKIASHAIPETRNGISYSQAILTMLSKYITGMWSEQRVKIADGAIITVR